MLFHAVIYNTDKTIWYKQEKWNDNNNNNVNNTSSKKQMENNNNKKNYVDKRTSISNDLRTGIY